MKLIIRLMRKGLYAPLYQLHRLPIGPVRTEAICRFVLKLDRPLQAAILGGFNAKST